MYYIETRSCAAYRLYANEHAEKYQPFCGAAHFYEAASASAVAATSAVDVSRCRLVRHYLISELVRIFGQVV